jgi:hypothetical protein
MQTSFRKCYPKKCLLQGTIPNVEFPIFLATWVINSSNEVTRQTDLGCTIKQDLKDVSLLQYVNEHLIKAFVVSLNTTLSLMFIYICIQLF